MRRLVLFEPTRLMREGLARLLVESGYEIAYQDNRLDPERVGTADASVDLVLTELPDPEAGMVGWIERLSSNYPNAKVVVLTNCSEDPQRLAEAFEQGAAGYLAKTSSFDAMHAALDAVMDGQVVYPRSLREGLARAAARPAPAENATPRPTTNGHAAIAAAPATVERLPRAEPDQGWRRPSSSERRPAASSPPPIQSRDADQTRRDRDVGGQNAIASRHPALPPHGAHMPNPLSVTNGDATDQWLRHKGLSEREAEILRYVATGDANKVIANRLEISEATVKSHIKSLLRKLDFQNRTQAAVWAHSHAAQLLNGSFRRAAE